MRLDVYERLELGDHEHLARGMGVAAARLYSGGDKSGYDVLGDDVGDIIASAYRLHGAEAAAGVFAAFYVGQRVQFDARSQKPGEWGPMRDHLHMSDAHGLTAEDFESIREAIGSSAVDV